MPRAVRKSVSRCSSRSSNRSGYRKRHSPRDNLLGSIREAFRSSVSANRYSPFRRESPPPSPIPAPPMMQPSVPALMPHEIDVRKIEQEIETPKRAELTEANIPSRTTTGLFKDGIRYIMLPLHLFHLCVWGSPTPPSSEAKEKNTSPLESKESDKKSSPHPESKISTSSSNSSSKTLSSSASSSGFSSSSSTSSFSRFPPVNIPASIASSTSTDAQPIVTVSSTALSSSSTSSVPTIKSSHSNRKNPFPRRIWQEDTTDESSDEMVTAGEDSEDSSNDQWSNAVSLPSMNMSIDLESYSNFEKLSSNLTASCPMEEPMDVSMEESNVKQWIHKSPSRALRANAIKTAVEKISETSSSSSSTEDDRSIYQESSNSSVDREIANIFQRACTSSSSDDEDYSYLNGRRNNEFINRSSDFGLERFGSRLREEICDAVIRKKRTFCQYDRLPEVQAKRINRGSSGSHSIVEGPIGPSKIKVSREYHGMQSNQEATESANQADSAFSDEDVEMNSINDSIIRLQSVHMQSLQESVVEWMDQDLYYVADTEDSNDDSTFPGRTRISSTGAVSSASADQGFVERDSHPRDLETSLGEWKQISALERSMLNGQNNPPEERTPSRDWNRFSGLETSTINGQIVPREDGMPLAEWNKISGLDRSINAQFPVPQEADADFVRWRTNFGVDKLAYDVRVPGRGLADFPETLQHPAGTSCDCGNPNCVYVPLAVPADVHTVNWTRNYPRPPSPLRHLYYEYPEFMSPPAEASTGGHQSPYVLIPVPANLVCPELA